MRGSTYIEGSPYDFDEDEGTQIRAAMALKEHREAEKRQRRVDAVVACFFGSVDLILLAWLFTLVKGLTR